MSTSEKQAELRQIRQQLIAKHSQAPGFRRGKRVVLIAVIALIAPRALHLLLQVIFVLTRGGTIGQGDIVTMAAALLLSLAVGAVINAGVRSAVWLAIIGGVYSLYTGYTGGIFSLLATPDVFLNVINIVFIATALFQLAGMVFISVDKSSGTYFAAMIDVQREIADRAKSGV